MALSHGKVHESAARLALAELMIKVRHLLSLSFSLRPLPPPPSFPLSSLSPSPPLSLLPSPKKSYKSYHFCIHACASYIMYWVSHPHSFLSPNLHSLLFLFLFLPLRLSYTPQKSMEAYTKTDVSTNCAIAEKVKRCDHAVEFPPACRHFVWHLSGVQETCLHLYDLVSLHGNLSNGIHVYDNVYTLVYVTAISCTCCCHANNIIRL